MAKRRLQRRAEKHRRHAREVALGETRAPLVREAERVVRLAYTRTQAAQALGISRSSFRRLLPYVETIELPWGARLIPVDELERLVTEQRRPARPRPAPPPRGRPRVVPPDVVERIRAEHRAGKSLGQIARDLNAGAVPTAHRGAKWWSSTVRAVLERSGGSAGSSGG
jgi:hypothetical protein